jgi:hypothetical protein
MPNVLRSKNRETKNVLAGFFWLRFVGTAAIPCQVSNGRPQDLDDGCAWQGKHYQVSPILDNFGPICLNAVIFKFGEVEERGAARGSSPNHADTFYYGIRVTVIVQTQARTAWGIQGRRRRPQAACLAGGLPPNSRKAVWGVARPQGV